MRAWVWKWPSTCATPWPSCTGGLRGCAKPSVRQSGNLIARLPAQQMPVGIMGFGILGQQVAKALLHFGYPVNAWSQTPRSVEGVRHYAGPSQLSAFFGCQPSAGVLTAPNAPNRKYFEPRNPVAIALGGLSHQRGPGALVVDDDLLALLGTGHLRAAWLDVFRQEPLPAEHPFWQHPAITVTPHISAPTQLDASVAQIAQKLAMLEAEVATMLVAMDRAY